MPEGDSVRRHAARLAPLLVGARLEKVLRRGATLGALGGAQVVSIEPRGKHLLLALDRPYVVHVHLGINGGWRTAPRGEVAEWQLARADLALVTHSHALWARARTVEVLHAAFARAQPQLAALGPDILAAELDLESIVARARRGADRPVSELLLDQRVSAGIGNIFRNETLFLERVHPATPVAALDDAALGRLYTRARRLMGGERRDRVWVYDRRGRPCYACGTAIAGRREAERQIFWCPRCQPAPPA